MCLFGRDGVIIIDTLPLGHFTSLSGGMANNGNGGMATMTPLATNALLANSNNNPATSYPLLTS